MDWQPVWNDIFEESEWGKYPSVELIRFIARNYYTKNRSEISFLELGCGPGPNLWYLAREGFQVFGIDGSSIAIEKSRKRLDTELPYWKGEVWEGDYTQKLPIEDGSMDAIIDSEAVYCSNFETAISTYKNCFRALKKGGKLWVMTFAEGTFGSDSGEVKDGMRKCITGPLGGKGFSRFVKYNDISLLLPDFKINAIELIERSFGGYESGNKIREWIIEAEKK